MQKSNNGNDVYALSGYSPSSAFMIITFVQRTARNEVLVQHMQFFSDERYFLVLTLEFKIHSIKTIVSFSFYYVMGLIDQGRGKGRDCIYDIKLSSIRKYHVT